MPDPKNKNDQQNPEEEKDIQELDESIDEDSDDEIEKEDRESWGNAEEEEEEEKKEENENRFNKDELSSKVRKELATILEEIKTEFAKSHSPEQFKKPIYNMLRAFFRLELINRYNPEAEKHLFDVEPQNDDSVFKGFTSVFDDSNSYLNTLLELADALATPETGNQAMTKLEALDNFFTFDDELNVSCYLTPKKPELEADGLSVSDNPKEKEFRQDEMKVEDPDIIYARVHQELYAPLKSIKDELSKTEPQREALKSCINEMLKTSLRLDLLNFLGTLQEDSIPEGVDPTNDKSFREGFASIFSEHSDNYNKIVQEIEDLLMDPATRKNTLAAIETDINKSVHPFDFVENLDVKLGLSIKDMMEKAVKQPAAGQGKPEAVNGNIKIDLTEDNVQKASNQLSEIESEKQNDPKPLSEISLNASTIEKDETDIFIEPQQPGEQKPDLGISNEQLDELRKLADELKKTDSLLSRDSEEYKTIRDCLNVLKTAPTKTAVDFIRNNAARYMEKRQNTKLSSRQQKRLAVINKILNVYEANAIENSIQNTEYVGKNEKGRITEKRSIELNSEQKKIARRVAEDVLQEFAVRLQEYPDKKVNGKNRNKNGVDLQTDRAVHNKKLAAIMNDPNFQKVIWDYSDQLQANKVDAKEINNLHKEYLNRLKANEKAAKAQAASEKKLQKQGNPVQKADTGKVK